MKIVNFNSHQQHGTYRAWNKQYLYGLNAKITSLQDYITYNCPEYIIFNSPNTPKDQQIDLTVGLNPYQIDIDSQKVSLFFPSRLSWHQGFYNESNYGDGILLYWNSDKEYYQTYQSASCKIPEYTLLKKSTFLSPISGSGDDYDVFIRNLVEPLTTNLLSTDISYKKVGDSYVGTINKYIGKGCKVVPSFTSMSNLKFETETEPTYNEETGYLSGSFRVKTLISQIAKLAVQVVLEITPKDTNSQFQIPTEDNLSFSGSYVSNPFYVYEFLLINKKIKADYGAKAILHFNSDLTPFLSVTVPQGVWYLDDQIPVNIHTTSYTIEEKQETDKIDIKPYRNFPSGYICILNKRPIGEDNDNNTIKQLLDSYLIAPIGNGAFYYLGLKQSDLVATYTPNELGNFINQVNINLGQNLRYIIPETKYITSGAFGIQNISVSMNQTQDYVTDHVGNLWTGGSDLVGEVIASKTKEEVFMDVKYSIDSFSLERHLVSSFNTNTSENVSKNFIELRLF